MNKYYLTQIGLDREQAHWAEYKNYNKLQIVVAFWDKLCNWNKLNLSQIRLKKTESN